MIMVRRWLRPSRVVSGTATIAPNNAAVGRRSIYGPGEDDETRAAQGAVGTGGGAGRSSRSAGGLRVFRVVGLAGPGRLVPPRRRLGAHGFLVRQHRRAVRSRSPAPVRTRPGPLRRAVHRDRDR